MVEYERPVALITGCGKRSGIGAAAARALAATGHAVVVTDVEQLGTRDLNESGDDPDAGWQGVESLVGEIEQAGGVATAMLGSVAAEADARRMVGATLERHGRLDVLVNNAAAPFGLGHGDIETISVESWDAVMAINLRGTFLMCRAAVGPMRRQKRGRIVNISSAAGRAGSRANSTYSATKAGILGFTRSLALDVAASNITVNAICPGMIVTRRMRSGARAAGRGDEAQGFAAIAAAIPLARPGTPEEVGAMIAYLASDAAGFVTAQTIGIDGGALRF